ncbi:T9SS type A sorting domain-containing protein [Winogradskyella ursingii]|uniref:T9SS type A sorting domain-containing protein n=1 Tax=Winogradskyella ursingii TaxID=2686079 RepID=UPI0015CDB7E2|nr:T9SS type A sorting domain-containing protein [Winogradskyella ursingii]
MKTKYTILIFLMMFGTLSAQQYTLHTDLDATVSETSGLLIIDNTIITHNDSGNSAQLFEIDTSTGNITRTVTVSNATNIDWEDITKDDTYIYIGDFGNNSGNRTDLKIYRILISDYLNNTSVNADIIEFSYEDQTDFTSNPMNTNFDAEALIHYNNQLYIFTKNWENFETHVYQLPKSIGTQNALRIDEFNSDGLVTGATTNSADNSIVLCGYGENGPFLIKLEGFNGGLFSNGTINIISMTAPSGYSSQTEGIVALTVSEYYVSTEALFSNLQGLYQFDFNTLNIEDETNQGLTFYPNPAKTEITVECDNCTTTIYSNSGQLILSSNKKKIDISNLASGIYQVEMKNKSTKKSSVKKLIIK